MFIGASQTWGAGASSPNTTYPARVQSYLQATYPDSNYLVINCGISGTRSPSAFEFYSTVWYRYKPQLVVLDFGYNDFHVGMPENIARYIAFDSIHGIRTLCIAEPARPANLNLQAKHRIMQHVAETHGLPFIDMQPYMDNCIDSGFIWWDDVHMNDYGLQLFADKISPTISKILVESKSDSTNAQSAKY